MRVVLAWLERDVSMVSYMVSFMFILISNDHVITWSLGRF